MAASIITYFCLKAILKVFPFFYNRLGYQAQTSSTLVSTYLNALPWALRPVGNIQRSQVVMLAVFAQPLYQMKMLSRDENHPCLRLQTP